MIDWETNFWISAMCGVVHFLLFQVALASVALFAVMLFVTGFIDIVQGD